jgi:rare lipoprotein A
MGLTAAVVGASVQSAFLAQNPVFSRSPAITKTSSIPEERPTSEKAAGFEKIAKSGKLSIATAGPLLASFDRDASLGPYRDVAVFTEPRGPIPSNKRAIERHDASFGIASYYGHSRQLTAAHRSLPFGTRVRVTNLSTGQDVTVRINDRGPFIRGRIVDVSYSAAEKLGLVGRGVAKVKLEVVD